MPVAQGGFLGMGTDPRRFRQAREDAVCGYHDLVFMGSWKPPGSTPGHHPHVALLHSQGHHPGSTAWKLIFEAWKS